jgi:hypothetical protein
LKDKKKGLKMIKKKKKPKVVLGKPHEVRLIFKACNPWNLRHELDQTQIQTN